MAGYIGIIMIDNAHSDVPPMAVAFQLNFPALRDGLLTGSGLKPSNMQVHCLNSIFYCSLHFLRIGQILGSFPIQ